MEARSIPGGPTPKVFPWYICCTLTANAIVTRLARLQRRISLPDRFITVRSASTAACSNTPPGGSISQVATEPGWRMNDAISISNFAEAQTARRSAASYQVVQPLQTRKIATADAAPAAASGRSTTGSSCAA